MEKKSISEYSEITGADIWVRKLRTLFRRLDSNGHGYVCLDDIFHIITELMSIFPKMESWKSDMVVQSLIDLWFGYICLNGDQVQRTTAQLNENDFINNMQTALKGPLKERFDEILVKPMFQAADGNNDGLITLAEFNNVMKGLMSHERDGEFIFHLIDEDKKGKISQQQFHWILAEFFFSEDPKSKGAKLWGNLVNYKRPEDYGTIECGPVWESKMRTMFRRLDINQCGKLRCHNLLQIGRSIAQRNHLDRRRSDAVMRAMLNIWVKFIAVDKEGKHFAEINEKDFIHNLRSMINGEYRHHVDQFGWTFFKAVEVDGSGKISMNGYRSLQEAWSVGREEAEGMFKVIDSDKDGKISSDEYLSAWVDYFLGEDKNSPYKTFFGPVIHKAVDGGVAD